MITVTICLTQFLSKNHFAVEPDEILHDQKQEFRARNISKNVRCMVCQNQSIDESNAPLAKDLRILIRKKIKEGNCLKLISLKLFLTFEKDLQIMLVLPLIRSVDQDQTVQ